MNSVLVGMFDSQADATAARNDLMAAGFAADAVRITGGSTRATAAAASSASTTASTSASAPHSEGAIARFFEFLFGADDDDLDVDHHKSTYDEAFRRGSFGVTVAVTTDAEMTKAEEILNANGAIDVDERSEEWKKQGWAGSAAIAGGAVPLIGSTQQLHEVRERLSVGKRTMTRGGVRVFTRLTEVPVEESVALREERADIRRTPVDRVATPADLAAFEEGSLEIRETGEEAVVRKTARVTGEVEVGKTATTREETIRDTVRETKVEVEKMPTGGPVDIERGR